MCSVTRHTHTHRLTAVVEARLWPPGTYGLGLLGPGLSLSLESFIDNFWHHRQTKGPATAA